ncbi:Hypothetical protein CINCED_3A018935 [Cinara cedri]|uniref:Uncharacterized protein n=1 Tax=Cinara cedri TaxID=506608 RepID=A0A5E4NHD4_9HEMI|nr:Hypothetical protein CINCED_3A018935 [Cinara cedri]
MATDSITGIFLKINTFEDCLNLQDDLNNFSVWVDTLDLSLSINKCRSMTFTRSRSPTTYSYTLNGSNLIPVDSSICDLGYTFTSSLRPRAHIDKITCKALKYDQFSNMALLFEIHKRLIPVYNSNGCSVNSFAT